MWFLCLISVVFAFYALDFYMNKISRFGRLLGKIPGPKGYPLIGALPLLANKSRVALFHQNRHWSNTYKNIFSFRVFDKGLVSLNHPDDIEVILSSTKYIQKDALYDLFHPWLGDGLLMSYGAKWQKRRKLLTPAFHFSILRDAVNIFQEQSITFVNSLIPEDGKEVDVLPPVTQFTLHSMTESAMGHKLEDGTNKVSEYKSKVYEMGIYMVYRAVRLWLHHDFIFALTKIANLQKKAIKELHKFTKGVINERRLNGNTIQLHGDELKISETKNAKSSKRLAMLDLMLAIEKKGEIDAEGIQEEVDTFMFEGHDTTSSAITFLLMNLACHSEVQELIVEELQGILSSPDEKASMEDLNKMTYLECCIKESLRLYPSVHFFSRRLTEDVVLKNRDYLIPKGAMISFHPFDVHRNAEFFPNPTKFDPERFFPENSVGRHPFSYIPFSAGPRNCIGQKFAMLEMKSVVSTILRKFTLLPVTRPKDIIFIADIILKARDPVKVKFVSRKEPF